MKIPAWLGLVSFLYCLGATPSVKGDSPWQEESKQSSASQNAAELPKQIIQKVISEESSRRITPYDYNCDGYNHNVYAYFCNPVPGCSAARFFTQHKEYMLVATYGPSGLVEYTPDLREFPPFIIQHLSIYECIIGKNKEKKHKKANAEYRDNGENNREDNRRDCGYGDREDEACIYVSNYKYFSDEDADGSLDQLTVQREKKTSVHDLENEIVETFRYHQSNWPIFERKMLEKEKKQWQREYETLLWMIVREYKK